MKPMLETRLGIVSKDALYELLAQQFHKKRLRAYLIRDSSAFPKLLGSDMDLLVSRESWRHMPKIIIEVLEGCGWCVVTRLRRGALHTWLVRRINADSLDASAYLQIDLHRFLTAYMVPFLDPSALFAHAIEYKGALFLDAVDGSTVSYLAQLLSNISPKHRYAVSFADAKRNVPERVAFLLGEALGRRGVDLVTLPSTRSDLWHRAFCNALWRRPFIMGAILWYKLVDVIASFVNPPGILVGFSGPDGVGKTTLISEVNDFVQRRLCYRAYRFHTRPFIIPSLRNLYARKPNKASATACSYPRKIGPIQSWLRVIILIIDHNLGYWVTIRPHLANGNMVLFDRHYLDYLVDSHGRGIVLSQKSLQRIGAWIPQPDLQVVLIARAETILARKQELGPNEIRRQLAQYRLLGSEGANRMLLETDDPTPREIASIVIDKLINLLQSRAPISE